MNSSLEHVDLELDLFLLVLCDIHHLDGSQLPRLGVPPLVHLTVGAVAHHLDQVKDPRRVLKYIPTVKNNISVFI